MKKLQKLSLSEIKINSFITTINDKESSLINIKGGTSTDKPTETAVGTTIPTNDPDACDGIKDTDEANTMVCCISEV